MANDLRHQTSLKEVEIGSFGLLLHRGDEPPVEVRMPVLDPQSDGAQSSSVGLALFACAPPFDEKSGYETQDHNGRRS
jgi:hypothetical protein